MCPPCSWQEALQPGAECLLHLLQEEGQEEDVLLTWRCHTNVKRKGAKGSAIAHDPRMALGTCELGQRSAVPCRAVLPAHFPALSQWGGFVLRRGSLQNWCSCRQQPVQLLSCVSWAECVRALLSSVCCFNLARLCQETRDSSFRAAVLLWA